MASSNRPETTIVATVDITLIIDDTLTEEEASEAIKDVIYGLKLDGSVDDVDLKKVKRFIIRED
jgi:hypothetical protein